MRSVRQRIDGLEPNPRFTTTQRVVGLARRRVQGGTVPYGFGLQGMKERAALLGGTLTAGPKPAGGWVVEAELPRDIG